MRKASSIDPAPVHERQPSLSRPKWTTESAVDPRKLAFIRSLGPAAFDLASRASFVLAELGQQKRAFIGLRRAAKVLRVSHHTLLLWRNRGLIRREFIPVHPGSPLSRPHPKYRVSDLVKLVELIGERVQVRPSPVLRFGNQPKAPFAVLADSKFEWQRNEKALSPREIANQIGCHPSTIIRAIMSENVRGRRRTPRRWEIRRSDWKSAFPGTICKKGA